MLGKNVKDLRDLLKIETTARSLEKRRKKFQPIKWRHGSWDLQKNKKTKRL
jgi:hypothetical protein